MDKKLQKRLFVGLAVDVAELGEALIYVLKRLRIGADHKHVDIRWVAPQNLHITLSFLGGVDVEKIPEVQEVIQDVATNFEPFVVPVRNVGAFPNEQRASVIWLGVPGKRSLMALQEQIHQHLQQKGFVLDSRIYRPHITIGRLRSHRSVRDLISPVVRKDLGKIKIAEVILFESVLQGKVPKYIPLFSAPLLEQPTG